MSATLTNGEFRWQVGHAFPIWSVVWFKIKGEGEFSRTQRADGEIEIEVNGKQVPLAEHDQPVWQLRIQVDPAK